MVGDRREYVYAGTVWVDPKLLGLQGRIPSSVAVGSGSASVAADGTVTFTGCSSVSLNGVFDGVGQDTYEVYANFGTSVAGSVFSRLRAGGIDHASASYNRVATYTAYAAGPTRYSLFGGTSGGVWWPNVSANIATVNGRLTVFAPGRSGFTAMTLVSNAAASDRYLMHEFSESGVATVFDGFTIRPDAGTITGTVKVVKIS